LKRRLIIPKKPGKDYVTIFFGLPRDIGSKLKEIAQQSKAAESIVLRSMLDGYFRKVERHELRYQPLKKLSQLGGVRTTARTVRRDQDRKLRELSLETGRSISDIIREAIDSNSS